MRYKLRDEFDTAGRTCGCNECYITWLERELHKARQASRHSPQLTQPAIPAQDAFVKRARELGVSKTIASVLFRAFVRVQQAGA